MIFQRILRKEQLGVKVVEKRNHVEVLLLEPELLEVKYKILTKKVLE